MIDLNFLKDITMINGISGNEDNVKSVFKKYMNEDEKKYISDNLGSLVYQMPNENKKNNLKIMVVGHFDEVGFMINRIDEKGFIYFSTVGGWSKTNLLSQRVIVTNEDNKEFIGVIGSKPVHLMSVKERGKIPEIDEMFIDIGVKDKKEIDKLNIKIGDMITPYCEFSEMANKDYLLAKAWDNRAGIAVSYFLKKELEKEKLSNNVFLGGTVQEEVGLRGAKTITDTIKPDLAIAIDVGIAGDTPKLEEKDAQNQMGNGPLLSIMDGGQILPQKIKKYILDLAKSKKIPLQFEILPGGSTDAGRMQYSNGGTFSLTISIPARYIHSNVSIIHKNDLIQTVNLVKEIILDLDKEKLTNLK